MSGGGEFEAKIASGGPIKVELEPGTDYYWCSCGLSKNQPWCDGSVCHSWFSSCSFSWFSFSSSFHPLFQFLLYSLSLASWHWNDSPKDHSWRKEGLLHVRLQEHQESRILWWIPQPDRCSQEIQQATPPGKFWSQGEPAPHLSSRWTEQGTRFHLCSCWSCLCHPSFPPLK